MNQSQQLRIPIQALAKAPEGTPAFQQLVRNKLLLRCKNLGAFRITKRSFDFREGRTPSMVLSVDIFPKNQSMRLLPNIQELWNQLLPERKSEQQERPIVIGAGPAGLFCALTLAKAGLCPIVLERGASIQERAVTVENFWQNGKLDPDTNVQFGEGGAGTFSDGKLTTLVKEKGHLGTLVLETFIAAGAPEEIRIASKPHIGTDILRNVVVNLREEICRFGGEVHFHTKMTKLLWDEDKLAGIEGVGPTGAFALNAKKIFLCVGHSARDTFQMLTTEGVQMEQKPFSVGLRIQHPQELINRAQYGPFAEILASRYPADYKLSYHASTGRGVYTFCMCPGGFVVNSASEEGGVVTNGMSYHARNSGVANAAVLVSVTPSDFMPYARFEGDVLSGMRFQQHLEKQAFLLGGGRNGLPCMSVGNFLGSSKEQETYPMAVRGQVRQADLTTILPHYVTATLQEGLAAFDVKLKGFTDPKATLIGIESRTSSPIRILRDPQNGQSNIKGLYPVGEGAGYAGGIMSAAIDGIRSAKNAYTQV